MKYLCHSGWVAASLLIAIPCMSTAAESADPPKTVQWYDDCKLTIGYRPDAPPFSYAKPTSQEDVSRPAGYNVEICRQVQDHLLAYKDKDIEGSCKGISLEWVPVLANERFDKLRSGKIDLLCGVTTVTVKRLHEFEGSLFTFLTGASFMCSKQDNLSGLQLLKGKRVGYVEASTTERLVKVGLGDNDTAQLIPIPLPDYKTAVKSLRASKVDACVEAASANESDHSSTQRPPASLHEAESSSEVVIDGGQNAVGEPPTGNPTEAPIAVNASPSAHVDCVFGDRDVLSYYYNQLPPCVRSQIAFDGVYYTLEPYAIFVRRGEDPDLLYQINRRLVELFREDPKSRNSIHSIFQDFFGNARMSDHLTKLFEVQRLPFE